MKSILSSTKSTLSILAFWLVMGLFGIYRLNWLPSAVPITSDLIFSEGNCRQVVHFLSSELGFRLVGTVQESQAKEFILNELQSIERIKNNNTSFEIIEQLASGSHKFDFMGEPVIKSYSNITNIMVRLSCADCSTNAVLLNAHFDSTIVSMGAADDAAGVAIMIELIRLFSQRTLKNSIIFLFNGAEESLQDATHAFVTQHELASTVKAVLNLEAMGAKGKEILFQANSRELVDAYSRVPYPHASSLSNDIFGTGLIMSDTDFRQFVQYGNMVGLDFAFYQNSYHYHTTLDTIENIQQGSIQHFGENIFAILKYLAEDASDLEFAFDNSMLYFDYLGYFVVVYSKFVAYYLHLCIAVFAVGCCYLQLRVLHLPPIYLLHTFVAFLINFVAGLSFSLLIGVYLGKFNPMSWFSNEIYPVIVFGQTFLVGFLYRPITKGNLPEFEYRRRERVELIGSTMFWSFLMLISTFFGIASSYVCSLQAATNCLGLLVDLFISKGVLRESISPLSYIAILLPLASYSIGIAKSILSVFVPITGRIGSDAPVDVIISIVSVIVLILGQVYLVLPISFRFSVATRKRTFKLLIVSCFLTINMFSTFSPYTSQTPKRTFCSYLENTTSLDRGVHISFADIGSSETVLKSLSEELGVEPKKRDSSQTDRDWATIFPFSHFVENYYYNLTKINQPSPKKFQPQMTAETVNNKDGTRNIILNCHFENFIWTVVNFNGEIKNWNLAVPVPKGSKHHTIRHISGYGYEPTWQLNLTMANQNPIFFELSGVERDGFHELQANSSPNGLNWIWSDHFESAQVLRKVERGLPGWTARLFVGIVVSGLEI